MGMQKKGKAAVRAEMKRVSFGGPVWPGVSWPPARGARPVNSTLSTENHRQVFARLSDPIFNAGAMHNPPAPRVKKSH